MKKGFTLVELLIVVVVIVTLMTISFRIGGIGNEAAQRNCTINRMQRLENCLSGYYAAYGSYPPVKLHGSRDYTLKVNGYGLQCEDTDEHETELTWNSVKAACKSQPVAMCWPFARSKSDYVNVVSKMRQQMAKKPDPMNEFFALCDNGAISQWGGKKSWSDVHIFKFGVLSYLVPRFLVVMGGGNSSSGDIDHQLFTNQDQWKANNQLPCRFESGVPYGDWGEVCDDVVLKPWKIAVLPSQAVCARWLPNLEKTVAMTFQHEVYGVELRADDDEGQNSAWEIYDASQVGSGGMGANGGGQNFALNTMSVRDGWGNEFYYYSLPPHQSYTLWSGGPNGKTFPPWVDLNTLENKDRLTVQTWVADDMIQMSN